MNPDDFTNSNLGHLVSAEGAHAFVPAPLPRTLELAPELIYLLDEASQAVARLDGVGETIANPSLLIAPFLRREARLSSRIEGTLASMVDVYAYEAGDVRRGDAYEVANYVSALQRGIDLLDDLPTCVRLVLQLHEILLSGVRGRDERPGQIRGIQVWIGPPGTSIGDARFVPPPPDFLNELLSDWEQFVHDDGPVPPLVRCALAHYQFEAIHPFRDGNGRIGRLLIPLILRERHVLREPLLYLSAYFEQHRQRYYDELYAVSATGDWVPWLRFFLTGVRDQARDAMTRARAVRELHDDYRHRLQSAGASGSALKLADELFITPIVSRPRVSRLLEMTAGGARGVVDRLIDVGILSPVGDSRPQLFAADELIELVR